MCLGVLVDYEHVAAMTMRVHTLVRGCRSVRVVNEDGTVAWRLQRRASDCAISS